MADSFGNETMIDMFYFETSQYLAELEQSIICCEKSSSFCQSTINEVFRIMHNIKSSSAMMMLNNISALAHAIEDLFFFLREQKPQYTDYSVLSDLILEGVDFIKVELEKVKNGDQADGESAQLIANIKNFLSTLKQSNLERPLEESHEPDTQSLHSSVGTNEITPVPNTFQAVIHFVEGCQMENMRAFGVIRDLEEIAWETSYYPIDIMENDNSIQVIREQGFKITLKTDRSYSEVLDYLNHTLFIKNLELVEIQDTGNCNQLDNAEKVPEAQKKGNDLHNGKDTHSAAGQSLISVNINKLDKLMDLVGEMVIAEAMVTQNPELKGLDLDNFRKAARQLRKITSEVQDVVMSIRMVPLTTTFLKMNRIVRDMNKKLNKVVELELVGEETEVDKNIIDHIADPLMHLVRNAIDHGIETPEERQQTGKFGPAKVTIEAKNAGSDVLIIVKDNGRGLNKEKILKRAQVNALLNKPKNEMSDQEIYNLIFLPGFSTKDDITEFSGRGVGMDVVTKNIESVGGSVSVDSSEGIGTAVIIKIPLTLAIIDGMNINVGNSKYTIPTISIKESFRPQKSDIITDPDGNEMIMVRGQCYPLLRLHEVYGVKTDITEFTDGILIMVEEDENRICLFADKLLGQQQVVVKALPAYFGNTKRVRGLAGCTLLGDGSISLILDIAGLIGNR
ncbi:MAG: chemotaxis protein CheW [Bacillota bacterium]